MSVIARKECPIHGHDTRAYMLQGELRCGVECPIATCGQVLVEVEYVPASQLRGAVDLLRQARGFIEPTARERGRGAELLAEIDRLVGGQSGTKKPPTGKGSSEGQGAG
jgi:hypothetical protein